MDWNDYKPDWHEGMYSRIVKVTIRFFLKKRNRTKEMSEYEKEYLMDSPANPLVEIAMIISTPCFPKSYEWQALCCYLQGKGISRPRGDDAKIMLEMENLNCSKQKVSHTYYQRKDEDKQTFISRIIDQAKDTYCEMKSYEEAKNNEKK